MASEENSAYVQHEAARSAEMVELQAQLKRMLARSRDLSIARLGAQLPDLFDYYEPTEQAALRKWQRDMLAARAAPLALTTPDAGADPGGAAAEAGAADRDRAMSVRTPEGVPEEFKAKGARGNEEERRVACLELVELDAT